MCWTYDPRGRQKGHVSNEFPFITWDFQDYTLLSINDSIELGGDVLIEKSRDMGASWMTLLVFEWRWKFKRMESFKMLSMTEAEVDKTDDPDSLFWKLDYLLKMQPAWMNPVMERQHLMLANLERGNTISGDSTTGDAGRGGRKTCVYCDEFASIDVGEAIDTTTADVTECRIFNSTPKGTANQFYKIRQRIAAGQANEKGHAGKLITLHWTLHPEKSAGLWIDKDGRVSSPWYEKQKARRNSQQIAQELDIDYLGSGQQFFEAVVLDTHSTRYVRHPRVTGELLFDHLACTPIQFTDLKGKGRLKLWLPVNAGGNLPEDDYVVACDIAVGTGGDYASNSVASIGSRRLCQKIGEWACNNTRPEDMARFVISLCRWLRSSVQKTAKLIWEANGPGQTFTAVIKEVGYRYCFVRQQEESFTKYPSQILGWWSDKKTKNSLFGEYHAALKQCEFVNPSAAAIDECRQIVWSPSGDIAHSAALQKEDPTGAKDNHSDRVIADALLWHELKAPAPKQELKPLVPQACLMARRNRVQERLRARKPSYYE